MFQLKKSNESTKRFYLIREDVLPESVQKTIKVKNALLKNNNLTIYDAVKEFNLSRSAFYKYKDTIFPIDRLEEQTRNLTLILYVQDEIGMLATVLNKIAEVKGSVLTIHQSLPMKNRATITISLNATNIELSLDELMDAIKESPYVDEVEVIGMSM